MLPLLTTHLTTLQSEIAHHQQQLTLKKQEVKRLNKIIVKVEYALETLQNAVNTIKDIDEEAVTLLKEATLSLFPHQEASSNDNQQTQSLVKETIQPTNTDNQLELMNKTQQQSNEEDNQIKYISDRVAYNVEDYAIIIGLDDEIPPESLREIIEEEDIGEDFSVEDSIHFDTDCELIVYNAEEKEAITVAENLDKYLHKIENPELADTKIFKYKQKVKVIAGKDKKFIGKEGIVASTINEEGAYVQFGNHTPKYFWKNQLIAA